MENAAAATPAAKKPAAKKPAAKKKTTKKRQAPKKTLVVVESPAKAKTMPESLAQWLLLPALGLGLIVGRCTQMCVTCEKKAATRN